MLGEIYWTYVTCFNIQILLTDRNCTMDYKKEGWPWIEERGGGMKQVKILYHHQYFSPSHSLSPNEVKVPAVQLQTNFVTTTPDLEISDISWLDASGFVLANKWHLSFNVGKH